MKNNIIIEGSPARLIEGLSHIGYSLQSSVCDLIDNSISHGKAENIFVIFEYIPSTQKFIFLLYDDGVAMSRADLKNAMKFGSSDENYDKFRDLGRFGMGLKTASLAHCNQIRLTSKKKSGQPSAVLLDKHAVLKSDRWKYSEYNGNSATEQLATSINLIKEMYPKHKKLFHSTASYTLVQWDDISDLNDKACEYKSERHRANWIELTQGTLECHIKMVFHRFLNANHGLKKINIHYNGDKLTGWSPLCEGISTKYQSDSEPLSGLKFKFEKAESPAVIRRYILPKDNKEAVLLTEHTQHDTVMKIDKWQGLYFYRNNRLIDYGGWYDGTGTEPHITYARASVDLTSEHDKYFKLNVNKTKIKSIEPEFRAWLKANMPEFRGRAKKMYGTKKAAITNRLRKKNRTVEKVISDEAKEKNITVQRAKNNQIKITNSYGSFFEKEISNSKKAGNLLKGRIRASKLEDAQLLWKTIPDGDDVMQVEINSSNNLYKQFYTDEKKNERITAVIDAVILGLAFSEMNCKTEKSKEIFDDINRTVGHLVNRLIDKEVIK